MSDTISDKPPTANRHTVTQILIGAVLTLLLVGGGMLYYYTHNSKIQVITQTGDDPRLTAAVDSVERVNRTLIESKKLSDAKIDSLKHGGDSLELILYRSALRHKENDKKYDEKRAAVANEDDLTKLNKAMEWLNK